MIIISSVSLLLLLVSGHFLNSIAWIREKKESKEMIFAEDFPIHGPWIVSVGRFKHAININI
jgi:hypothetical protein